MKQFEIFRSQTRNFIKKKQLFPFFFFIMKSANTAERLAESGENSAERREVCQDQERGRWRANGPVRSRGIAVCGNGAFPGKHCQSLPQDTAHELSLSADRHSLLASPSGLGLDDTVNFSAGMDRQARLGQWSTARSAAALPLTWHRYISPSEDKWTCCKLVLLPKYLHLVLD